MPWQLGAGCSTLWLSWVALKGGGLGLRCDVGGTYEAGADGNWSTGTRCQQTGIWWG